MVLVGAGNRGRGVFGKYALDMPHRTKFIAVVDPDKKSRDTFAQMHQIPESLRFENPQDFLNTSDKIADAMVIATLETERLVFVLDAIDKGYHILVEKPLGCSLEVVIKITEAAARFNGIFAVCHQMRYVPGYSVIKSLIDSGRFGEIVTMQLSESLSWHHMAHSFVRGSFNNDSMTPMILAKSCHDMDIMRYLIGKPPVRVSSFGGLSYFKKEKAPEGAPAYCLDGCPAYNDCPYHVLKIYFGDDVDPAYARTMGVINSTQELFESLKSSRHGRCVFLCDNNVVDHQVVNIEFEGGVTASFQMAGHNYLERRIIKISMTNGEISFDVNDGVIKAYTFSPTAEEIIKPAGMSGDHMGGDRVIMDSFVDAVRTGDRSYVLTPVHMSLDSHLMAFAAEKSRREIKVVEIKELKPNPAE